MCPQSDSVSTPSPLYISQLGISFSSYTFPRSCWTLDESSTLPRFSSVRFRPLCFLTIRGFRPIIGPAVFALLVTTSRTLLSFFPTVICVVVCTAVTAFHTWNRRERRRLTRFHTCKGRIQSRSHRHFEKTAARIRRFHYKDYRKKGQMDQEKNNFVPTSYVLTYTSRTK